MNNSQKARVAPMIALLVIILGIITIFVISNVNFIGTPFTTTPSVDNTISPSPNGMTVFPTATAADTLTEYNDHLVRNELHVALYHLEASSAVNGWTAQTHIRVGNLWRDMGDLGRALPHWEAANAEDPNPNLLRQIAEIYIELGEWSIAWQRIQVLLELAPNDAWALYHGGLILAPTDPETAFGYLGRVSALNDTFSETAQSVLDAIGDTQTSSDVVLRVGASLAAAEEWSLAENAYQYAADLYYPFAEATAYVGLMRILQGKNGADQINEAIRLDGENPDVHYVAGVYWRSAGEYRQSEDQLLQAILLEPDNPTFHAELGNTYRAMGNFLDAEIWLQTAVIVSDNNPLMVNALNSFYEDEAILISTNIIRAEADLSEAEDPSVLSANGWALYVQGNVDEGLALIEQALAINPNNPRALFDKARIFLEIDRVPDAINLLQQLSAGQSVFAGPAQGLLERETTTEAP